MLLWLWPESREAFRHSCLHMDPGSMPAFPQPLAAAPWPDSPADDSQNSSQSSSGWLGFVSAACQWSPGPSRALTSGGGLASGLPDSEGTCWLTLWTGCVLSCQQTREAPGSIQGWQFLYFPLFINLKRNKGRPCLVFWHIGLAGGAGAWRDLVRWASSCLAAHRALHTLFLGGAAGACPSVGRQPRMPESTLRQTAVCLGFPCCTYLKQKTETLEKIVCYSIYSVAGQFNILVPWKILLLIFWKLWLPTPAV